MEFPCCGLRSWRDAGSGSRGRQARATSVHPWGITQLTLHTAGNLFVNILVWGQLFHTSQVVPYQRTLAIHDSYLPIFFPSFLSFILFSGVSLALTEFTPKSGYLWSVLVIRPTIDDSNISLPPTLLSSLLILYMCLKVFKYYFQCVFQGFGKKKKSSWQWRKFNQLNYSAAIFFLHLFCSC